MLKLEVRIDGRAWIPKSAFTQKSLEKLRKNLSIRLKPSSYDEGPVVVNMLEETDFHVGLPRGYFDRTSGGKLAIRYDVCDDKRNLVPAIFARDDVQSKAIDDMAAKLMETKAAGGILCAATGVGKTVMGLLIAGKIGYSTLIVVHTKVLMDQWVERISSKPGVFPDANVGIFQADREEFGDDYDIVIAMVHSLANRPDGHPIFSWPGLVIVDETHRMGAPTWNSVAHRFNAAKRLGLTATPYRRDGGERLFLDTVGQIAVTVSAPMLTPKVKQVTTAFEFKKNGVPVFLEDKMLSSDPDRNQQIVREVSKARKVGRNILILTKLVNHALVLKQMISSQVSGSSIGICVGSWYADERDASDYLRSNKKYQLKFKTDGQYDWRLIDPEIHKVEWKDPKNPRTEFDINRINDEIDKASSLGNTGQVKLLKKLLQSDIAKVEPKRRTLQKDEFASAIDCDIIIATYQMVSEGFDVPRLDTLFLAMPVSDPVQSTGRILRAHPNKKEPIVTHFIDENVPKYKRAWQSCRRHYQDLGADL